MDSFRSLTCLACSVFLIGCNAVFGLDERASASDAAVEEETASADSSVVVDSRLDDEGAALETFVPDTSVVTVRPDSAMTIEGGVPDATSMVCPTTCPAGHRCVISWFPATGAYTTACSVTKPLISSPFSPCVAMGLDQYVCGDGYACGWLYPGKKACFPLCTSAAGCTDPEAPYCNYKINELTSRCGQCNPHGAATTMLGGSDCAGPTTRCMVINSVSAPLCGKFGDRSEGEPCSATSNCRHGLVCECGGLAGAPRLGTECAAEPTASLCRRLCVTDSGCSATTKCTAVGSTGYSVCR